jgi:hypothetical protein
MVEKHFQMISISLVSRRALTATRKTGVAFFPRRIQRDREMVKRALQKKRCWGFAVMEGGYNHEVLDKTLMEFIRGMKLGCVCGGCKISFAKAITK